MVPVRDLNRYGDVGVHEFPSLEDFLDADCNQGISSIELGDVHLDLLVDDRNCETTVVIFHTALDPAVITTPVFVGQGLMNEVNANVICCSDPALELGVGLGWFIGKRGIDFQNGLTTAIQHLLKSFKRHKHLVFYGPSGGGFASLYYSYQFPKSLAIPVNPQTNIDAYSQSAVENYCMSAWGANSGLEVPAVTDLNILYSGEFENDVLYLQNLGDRAHISKQLTPFLTAVSDNRVMVSLGKWGLGHRAPQPEVQRPFIEAAIQVEGQWDRLNELVEIAQNLDPEEIQKWATEYTLAEKRAKYREAHRES